MDIQMDYKSLTEISKDFGFKNLAQFQRIIQKQITTLSRWKKNRPFYLKILLLGSKEYLLKNINYKDYSHLRPYQICEHFGLEGLYHLSKVVKRPRRTLSDMKKKYLKNLIIIVLGASEYIRLEKIKNYEM